MKSLRVLSILVPWSLCACDVPSSEEAAEVPAGDSSDAQAAPVWEPIDPLYLETVHDTVTPQEVPGFWERMPVDVITLKSSGCYGVCPAYEVTLSRGGSALFHGRDFVGEMKGQHTGRIGVSQFARLCLMLERFRFEEMDERYASDWNHGNTMTMTVRYADREEPVVVTDSHEQSPPEFHALTLAIDEVVREVDWKLVAWG